MRIISKLKNISQKNIEKFEDWKFFKMTGGTTGGVAFYDGYTSEDLNEQAFISTYKEEHPDTPLSDNEILNIYYKG